MNVDLLKRSLSRRLPRALSHSLPEQLVLSCMRQCCLPRSEHKKAFSSSGGLTSTGQLVAGFVFVVHNSFQTLPHPASVRADVVGFNLNPVLTLCSLDGSTMSSMHLLMKLMTEVVYSSMPLDESQNIFQSVLAKQCCSVASASSDHFRVEQVTGASCFSFSL